MLSIGRMACGQGRYYLELAQEDYYTNGGEPPGKWWGQTAKHLGIKGTVSKDQLRCLFAGLAPDGQPLVQNAGSPNRRPGFDLTFSAPKSVSVLWSQVDSATRAEIQKAHEAAIHEALRYIEEVGAYTRRGKGGITKVQAGLIAALFEHGTSRAADPQLHTHCLLLNLVLGADGQFGALEGHAVYKLKMIAGVLYRVELAHQLITRLGVQCLPNRSWFEIEGVPQNVIAGFSKRRADIEKALSAKGLESASAAAIATLETRGIKYVVPPRKELFAVWQKEARDLDVRQITVDSVRNASMPKFAPPSNERRFENALEKLTSSLNYFSEQAILRNVAEQAQAYGVSAQSIRSDVKRLLASHPEIVKLDQTEGQPALFTTKSIMELETELISTAQQLRNTKKHWFDPVAIGIAKTRKPLNQEQKKALEHLTVASAGQLRLVQGMAGTGKTTLLSAAREAWESSGYRVQGVCVAGKAAKGLQQGSGITSDTLAMLKIRMKSGIVEQSKHHAEQIARAAFKLPTFKWKPFKIDSKTILVVDEAGMLGTKDLAKLVAATKKGGGLLVLVGDKNQIQAIGEGGGFAGLLSRFAHAELKEIVRQKDERDRDVVRNMSKGEVASAFENLDQRDRLRISQFRNHSMDLLVQEWARRETRRPEESLIFCGTNSDADYINRLCQKARLERGELSRWNFLTVGQDKFHVGDRILFTQRAHRLGLENGETGTIESLNFLEGKFTVKIDDGESRSFRLRDYDSIRLGYAVTTHKGQGTTVERAYVLAGGSMQDREISYVQMSRARQETWLYVNKNEHQADLQAVARQMSRTNAKLLAQDAMLGLQKQQSFSPTM